MGSPDGGFLWESYRNHCLKQWGWKQLEHEPGCFLVENKTDGTFVRLLADTDDFLLSSPSESLLNKALLKLKQKWQVTEQVPIDQHMGVAISRNTTGISLSVEKYIEELALILGLTTANSTKLPHDPRADLSSRKPDEEKLEPELARKYQKEIGVARFIVDTVCYEIAYITSVLAQSTHDPAPRHYAALKRLTRYLIGNKKSGLKYVYGSDCSIKAFSDSDYAACPSTRRSRTGIAIQFAGDLIFWKSVLQRCVTISTAEAEYTAVAEVARVLLWLKNFAEEWKIPLPSPIDLKVDNSAAVTMASANRATTRSKHIDVKCQITLSARTSA